MKIAILLLNSELFQPFDDLTRKLTARGHEVKVIVSEEGVGEKLVNEVHCDWVNLDFSAITDFSPDVVLSWGDALWYHLPAIPMLKGRYPLFVMELAWLGEKESAVYLLESNAFTSRFLESGFKSYIPNFRKVSHHDFGYSVQRSIGSEYVYVPMQPEEDPAFQYSPYFKSANSFLDFIEVTSGDTPVIIDRSMCSEEISTIADNVTVYEGPLTPQELMAGASVVVGVNSRRMIEALAFGKTVFSFGKSPASAGFLEGDIADPDFVANVFHSRKALPRATTNKVLRYLMCNQFSMHDVPEWAIRKIERIDFRVNFLG